MKNIAMADSKDVIEKVEDEKNNLQTDKGNEIGINQKESDLLENLNENNSLKPNSDVFYTLTSGENINYIDYKNNILNFSMIINEDSKSIEKENELYESEANGELNLNKNTVYKQILTSDAIGVYSTKYTKLPDDSYSFTKVTIPGKDNFSFPNEKKPLNGKYTIKIMALSKGKTRKFKSYETIYEGEWKNEEITKKIDNIKAIRVEISGLEEKINDFNITIEGNADISGYLSTNSNTVFNNQDEYKICYVISESFSESFDKDGNELTKSITELNYLKSDLYSEDYNNYGKGLLRSFNNLKIQEQLNHVVILAKHDLNNDKLLENAKYGLFADTKLSINDKIFMPGELIESKVTNEMGEIEFKIYGLLNNFYIKEIAPPSGYCSSDYLFYLKDAQQIVNSKDGIKIIGKVDDKNIIRINAYDEKKESNNSIESDSNDTKQNEEVLANQNNILDNDNQKNSNNGKDGNENKSTDLGKNVSENKNKSVDKDKTVYYQIVN